jgi:hypothetical protein
MNRFLRRVCQASPIVLIACAATVARAQGPQPAHQPGQTANQVAGTASPNESASISPLSSLKSHTADETYTPITDKQRLQWFITQTIAPIHLLGGGIISSAIGTALDRPYEYGSSWGGFGDRFGMRLTGISTGNAMEAGLGAIWGEDPRYFREPNKSFGGRVESVVKQTFLARRRDGEFAPAYARYIAVPGNNFLSNTWRVHSEANVGDALLRTAEGFGGRMASNAWDEFWPSISARVFHHGN